MISAPNTHVCHVLRAAVSDPGLAATTADSPAPGSASTHNNPHSAAWQDTPHACTEHLGVLSEQRMCGGCVVVPPRHSQSPAVSAPPPKPLYACAAAACHHPSNRRCGETLPNALAYMKGHMLLVIMCSANVVGDSCSLYTLPGPIPPRDGPAAEALAVVAAPASVCVARRICSCCQSCHCCSSTSSSTRLSPSPPPPPPPSLLLRMRLHMNFDSWPLTSVRAEFLRVSLWLRSSQLNSV